MSARFLARNMAATLRAVADEGHSFAIEHFGRVIGFLVPLEGREPVVRKGRTAYEVPRRHPLRDLTGVELTILAKLHDQGPCVPDQLAMTREEWAPMPLALCQLETGDAPLIVRRGGAYRLTCEGERHVEELGL